MAKCIAKRNRGPSFYSGLSDLKKETLLNLLQILIEVFTRTEEKEAVWLCRPTQERLGR